MPVDVHILLTPYGCTLVEKRTPFDFAPTVQAEAIRVPLGQDHGVAALREDELQVHWPADAEPALCRQIVLGPGLAALWTRRGHPVLHGSCVELSGAAIGVLGPSGRGKSTLAAQLHLRGHRLISDGLTLAVHEEGGLRAHPGPAWFKLDDVGLRALGQDPGALEEVHPGANKRLWEIHRAGAGPRPWLRALYVLEDGAELRVERLTGGAALRAVLDNMYLLPFLGGAVAPLLFRQAALVARSVPVSRLTRPRGFAHAAATVALLERERATSAASHQAQAAPPPRDQEALLERPRGEG